MEKESGKAGTITEELGALTQEDPGLDEETFLGQKSTTYYVEENERILNLLITNC